MFQLSVPSALPAFDVARIKLPATGLAPEFAEALTALLPDVVLVPPGGAGRQPLAEGGKELPVGAPVADPEDGDPVAEGAVAWIPAPPPSDPVPVAVPAGDGAQPVETTSAEAGAPDGIAAEPRVSMRTDAAMFPESAPPVPQPASGPSDSPPAAPAAVPTAEAPQSHPLGTPATAPELLAGAKSPGASPQPITAPPPGDAAAPGPFPHGPAASGHPRETLPPVVQRHSVVASAVPAAPNEAATVPGVSPDPATAATRPAPGVPTPAPAPGGTHVQDVSITTPRAIGAFDRLPIPVTAPVMPAAPLATAVSAPPAIEPATMPRAEAAASISIPDPATLAVKPAEVASAPNIPRPAIVAPQAAGVALAPPVAGTLPARELPPGAAKAVGAGHVRPAAIRREAAPEAPVAAAPAIPLAEALAPLRRAAPPDSTAMVAVTPLAPEAPRVVSAPQHLDAAVQGEIDTRRHQWMATMVEHIEAMRDAAPVRETSLRLTPDALGTLDVTVTQDGDGIQVHFTTETAAARALISEAQPRLAELAEARGLRITQTSVDGGGAGQGQNQGQRQDAARAPAPAPARTAAESDSTDERIA